MTKKGLFNPNPGMDVTVLHLEKEGGQKDIGYYIALYSTMIENRREINKIRELLMAGNVILSKRRLLKADRVRLKEILGEINNALFG